MLVTLPEVKGMIEVVELKHNEVGSIQERNSSIRECANKITNTTRSPVYVER